MEVAHRSGFTLVTSKKVDEVIRERYHLDYSLSGEIDHSPRENHSSKVFANLISTILTDMAVLNDLVVVECGGQFIFRAFPNAMHVRVVAPRDLRAHNIMEERGISFEQALEEMEELMRDLHGRGVSMITVGQYLPPSGSHLPLERYVTPEEFAHYREYGLGLGIRQVASGPLVRSSYHAEEQAGKTVFIP